MSRERLRNSSAFCADRLPRWALPRRGTSANFSMDSSSLELKLTAMKRE